MTLELMVDWLGHAQEHWPGALPKPQSILTMDAFRCQLTHRIRNMLWNKNNPVIIPVRQLQPPNLSIILSQIL